MDIKKYKANGLGLKTNKKIYLTLLISYGALLILLVVAMAGLFILSAGSITEQLRLAGNDISKKAVDMMDSEIDSCFTRSGVILTDERVRSLKNFDEYTPDETVLLMQLTKTLKQELVRENLIKEIHVFFEKTGYVLNTGGFFKPYSFDYRLKTNMGISYEQWEEILSFNGTRDVRLIKGTDRNGKPLQSFLIINKYQTMKKDNASCIVVFELDINKIWQMVNTMQKSGYIHIAVDSKTARIETDDPFTWKTSDINTSAKISGLSLLFSKEPLHTIAKSDQTGFVWHFFSENTEYRVAIKQLFTIFISLTLLIIVLGNMFIFYAARSQYKPLQSLLEQLMTLSGEAFNEETSEYETIDRALAKLQAQKSNDESSLSRYRAMVKDASLRNMLLGLVNEDSSLMALSEKYSLGFLSEQCQVILLSIDEDSLSDIDINDESGDSAFSFIISYITEVLDSVSFDENKTLFCEVRGYIACVISYSGEEPGENEQRLKGREFAKKIVEMVGKRFCLDLYVGISDIYYSQAGLQHAYAEASEIIEYATLTGEKNEILDSTLLPFEDTSAADSLRTMAGSQTMLINCLRLGNYENAREIINDRLLKPLKKNRSGARSAVLKLELLRDILLEAFYEIRGLLPEEEWKKLKVDKRIYEATSLDAISESVNRILDGLISAADSADANLIREKDDKLVSYVNTHFTDPNINIMQLAEMNGMSTSYYSKSFKRVAGVGLLDYIHSLRIQRAKVLLETTDKSINVISSEVGYANSLTMIRAFKRYEGITPSEYKKIASSC